MHRHLRPAVAVAFACGLLAAPVVATAAPRTFVASTGLDTNPCSLAQPCRSFATAVAAADAGGEVVALDSAGFGALTIAKSLTVVAPEGVHAGITVAGAGGDAITVDDPGAVVTLRNLRLNATGGALSRGVVVAQALRVSIEGLQFAGFTGTAVDIPAASSMVSISGSTIRGGSVYGNGIVVSDASRLTIADSRIDQVYVGVAASNGAYVSMTNLRVAHVTQQALAATAGGTRTTAVAIERSEFFANGVGIPSSVGPSAAIQTSADGLTSRVDLTMSDSVVSFSPGFAALQIGWAFANQGPQTVTLTGNRIVNNAGQGIAIQVGQFDVAKVKVVMSRNSVTRNSYGVGCNGGGLVTRSDNAIYDNVVAQISNCGAPGSAGHVQLGGN
jgi:hypothetical protein